jgi:hypothetical protein
VLVSRDWGIYTEPDLAREVVAAGISIVWLYHKTGNMGARDQLFVLARDLRLVEAMLGEASGPMFIAIQMNGRPRKIPPPTGRAYRPGRPKRS